MQKIKVNKKKKEAIFFNVKMRFPNKFKNRKSLYATRCTTHMNVSVWNKGRNQKSQTKKKNKERRLYQTLPRQNDMCEHNFAPKLESRV